MQDATDLEIFMVVLFEALPGIFICAFMAILFLQSGLDKALHYQSNKAYFQEHFNNSPLSKSVHLLMPVITVMELSAGFLSALGVFQLFFHAGRLVAYIGLAFAAISLLCLFLGQRIAKDYAGAAVLVPYFLVAVAGMLVLHGR